jgi:hypothetical protein
MTANILVALKIPIPISRQTFLDGFLSFHDSFKPLLIYLLDVGKMSKFYEFVIYLNCVAKSLFLFFINCFILPLQHCQKCRLYNIIFDYKLIKVQ